MLAAIDFGIRNQMESVTTGTGKSIHFLEMERVLYCKHSWCFAYSLWNKDSFKMNCTLVLFFQGTYNHAYSLVLPFCLCFLGITYAYICLFIAFIHMHVYKYMFFFCLYLLWLSKLSSSVNWSHVFRAADPSSPLESMLMRLLNINWIIK